MYNCRLPIEHFKIAAESQSNSAAFFFSVIELNKDEP